MTENARHTAHSPAQPRQNPPSPAPESRAGHRIHPDYRRAAISGLIFNVSRKVTAPVVDGFPQLWDWLIGVMTE